MSVRHSDTKYLKVSMNSLKETSDALKAHNLNITNNLQAIMTEFKRIEECFDSDASKEYQKVMNEYMKKTMEKVNSQNDYLVEKLNEINNMYLELYGEVKNSITGTKVEKL